MKIQDLLEELQDKKGYKTFKEENSDTFFAAAFLILDLENKTEQIQLDFFMPTQNKIAAFCFPFNEPKIHEDIILPSSKGTLGSAVSKSETTEPAKPATMQPQTTKIKIDIDDLEKTCNNIIKENESRIAPTKIISILKDNIWNLTCMDNMLGIVRIKINAISGELIDFNKGGLMDFMGIKKK